MDGRLPSVVFLWCGVGGWVGYGLLLNGDEKKKKIACAELRNVHLVQGNGAGSECVLDSWKPSLRKELDIN